MQARLALPLLQPCSIHSSRQITLPKRSPKNNISNVAVLNRKLLSNTMAKLLPERESPKVTMKPPEPRPSARWAAVFVHWEDTNSKREKRCGIANNWQESVPYLLFPSHSTVYFFSHLRTRYFCSTAYKLPGHSPLHMCSQAEIWTQCTME